MLFFFSLIESFVVSLTLNLNAQYFYFPLGKLMKLHIDEPSN